MARGASAARRAERAGEAARTDGVCARAVRRTTGWRASTRGARRPVSPPTFGGLPCHVAGARGRDLSAQPLRSRQLLLLKTNNGDRNHSRRARARLLGLDDVSWVADAWCPAHAWVGAWGRPRCTSGRFTRPARYRAPRDHPAVIRRRTVSLLGTCVASCALPRVALRRRRARARARRGRRAPRDRRRGDGPSRRRARRSFVRSRDRPRVVAVRARRIDFVFLVSPRTKAPRASPRARPTRASVRSSLARSATTSPSSAVGPGHPTYSCPPLRPRRDGRADGHPGAAASASGARPPPPRARARMIAAAKRAPLVLLPPRRIAPAAERARRVRLRQTQLDHRLLHEPGVVGGRQAPALGQQRLGARQPVARRVHLARAAHALGRAHQRRHLSAQRARRHARDADHASAAGRGTASGNAARGGAADPLHAFPRLGGSRASEGQRRDQRLVTFSMTLVRLSAFWFFNRRRVVAHPPCTRTAPTTSSSSVAACSGCSSARRANVAAAGVAAHRSRNRARTAATRATTASSSPRRHEDDGELDAQLRRDGIPPPRATAATCARIASRLPSRDSRRCFSGNASFSESFVSNRSRRRARERARRETQRVPRRAYCAGMARSPSPASDSARSGADGPRRGNSLRRCRARARPQSPSRCEHRARSRNHSRRDRRDRAAASRRRGLGSLGDFVWASSRRSLASYMSRALDASPSICAVSAARVREARVGASSPSNARASSKAARRRRPPTRGAARRARPTRRRSPRAFSFRRSFLFLFLKRDTSASWRRRSALWSRKCEISWSFVSSRASWSARPPARARAEPRHPPSNAAAAVTASASKRASGSAAAARSATRRAFHPRTPPEQRGDRVAHAVAEGALGACFRERTRVCLRVVCLRVVRLGGFTLLADRTPARAFRRVRARARRPGAR